MYCMSTISTTPYLLCAVHQRVMQGYIEYLRIAFTIYLYILYPFFSLDPDNNAVAKCDVREGKMMELHNKLEEIRRVTILS